MLDLETALGNNLSGLLLRPSHNGNRAKHYQWPCVEDALWTTFTVPTYPMDLRSLPRYFFFGLSRVTDNEGIPPLHSILSLPSGRVAEDYPQVLFLNLL
jgi:hypothetical protein